MITETTAVTLRQNLGDMLNRVQYRRDSILITKDGRPVAALVDAAMFERIRRMQERFDALSVRLAQAYEGGSSADGQAEIDAVSVQARAATAGQWRADGSMPEPPGNSTPSPQRTRRAAAAGAASTKPASAPSGTPR